MKNKQAEFSKRARRAVPHFVGYLRVSKERDTTGSYTFETQEQRIREFANREYGEGRYTIEFYKDDGLSGSLGLTPTILRPKVRPTLRIIADKVNAGECDGLLIYGQSRLFRNARGMMELVEDIILPNQIKFASATENLDVYTPDGRFTLYLNSMMHERQRDDNVLRNKDATATRAEEGFPIGQVGYGWQSDPLPNPTAPRHGIVFVEEEKHWVIHIKDRYLSGWNAPRIAAELNELDVPSPLRRALWSKKAKKQRTRDGREPRWTNGTVWNVVRNPLHAGLIRTSRGELIHGRHWEQRFWEPETLQEIEQVHSERIKRFKTVTGGQKQEHLLAGSICWPGSSTAPAVGAGCI